MGVSTDAILFYGYALTVDPEWYGMLDRFLSELGIAKPKGQERPAWWLVSYWN